jgi:hypothetical protein
MSAQPEELHSVPEEQGYLFDAKPWTASRVAMGLRGAGNLPIGREEIKLLENAEGTEQVLEIRVFVNVKGHTREYATKVYNLAVIDSTVVLD